MDESLRLTSFTGDGASRILDPATDDSFDLATAAPLPELAFVLQ